ncbi:MAG: hypothetical protein Q8M11_03260 [Sulfuritalea sp.]|nr:hypothetical protein [Sulfuritalea sp.]MDP1984587.1 hypothetical protein [Sulfuritalea sp.]
MTPERDIFRHSRRPLNILSGAILLSLTLAFGSIYVRDTLKEDIARSQGQLAAQRSSLTSKQLDLQNIRTHIAQFRSLKQQGLVGAADREGWVEQLAASRAFLNAGNALVYTLHAPRTQAVAAAADLSMVGQTAADLPLANADAAMAHDLDFELDGAHEAELLDLLQDYKAKVRGSFRVQTCRLGSPTATGLLAQCSLRFFNLPETPKPQ